MEKAISGSSSNRLGVTDGHTAATQPTGGGANRPATGSDALGEKTTKKKAGMEKKCRFLEEEDAPGGERREEREADRRNGEEGRKAKDMQDEREEYEDVGENADGEIGDKSQHGAGLALAAGDSEQHPEADDHEKPTDTARKGDSPREQQADSAFKSDAQSAQEKSEMLTHGAQARGTPALAAFFAFSRILLYKL